MTWKSESHLCLLTLFADKKGLVFCPPRATNTRIDVTVIYSPLDVFVNNTKQVLVLASLMLSGSSSLKCTAALTATLTLCFQKISNYTNDQTELI